MPFTLRIREIRSLDQVTRHHGDSPSTSLSQWDVEIGPESLNLRLCDPFAAIPAQPVTESEKTITWYLENHIREPFETTRAEVAANTLSTYGRDLASQIAQSGLLPENGDLQLHIISTASPRHQSRVEKSPESRGRPLQQLHWEVLEDVKVWPTSFRFSSVSVARSVTGTAGGLGESSTRERDSAGARSRGFKILLVVSRPRPLQGVDYQLVAKYLVAIVDPVSKTSPGVKVFLKILRPPTWREFEEHLKDNKDYDLVHFDMKGEIQKRANGCTSAVLEFCQTDLGNPLKMKRDFKTGDEVGKVLAQAGVRTVVLNACDSASFRDSTPGSNLAEVLLSHGVHSVLAMAYKVVDEAVEIFMGSFYRSLLARGTSVQDATRVARLALFRNQSRRASYMHNVHLLDYIVPVLYTSFSNLDAPGMHGTAEMGGRERILTSIKQMSPTNWTTPGTGTYMARELLGRDYNILSLEALLSASPVVLMHGQGGTGKTVLLRYVCEWWKLSGWITAAAYIDFDQRGMCSMEGIVEQIAHQLDFKPGERSKEEVIKKLSDEKYLIVFDSAEVFDTSIYDDRINGSVELLEELKYFIDAATSNWSVSMAIIASRLDTTAIAHIPSDHKYRLLGLSVLDSVSLLQDLSFGPTKEIPEIFYRRENIDSLRRAAILLEGNPAAIQLIVSELKKVDYNGEELLHTLLYGICRTHIDDRKSTQCRFVRSLYYVLTPSFTDFKTTRVRADQFAPFWNLMPKNLTIYYWFLYLSDSRYPEYSRTKWISQEFQDFVNNKPMARKLRRYWPDIEKKLINAGILTHATITKKNGVEIPCYHLHPICTLVSRVCMDDRGWREARFAFILQALLWDPGYKSLETEWAKAEWDDQGPQHDDYLHNWRAIAVGWSIQHGDPLEEVKPMGDNMVDCTYNLAINTAFNNPRQDRLLIPHIRAYLSQVHGIVNLQRIGRVPTQSDLQAIVEYSWRLWKIEADDAMQVNKSAIVRSALEAVERRKAASPPGTAILGPQEEATWFQLRHAEAENTVVLHQAKELYERNLMTDPMNTDIYMLNLIRRQHMQSLIAWVGCVVRMATRENTFDKNLQKDMVRNLTGFFGPKPGGMMRLASQLLAEHRAEVEKLRVRDHISFALEREPEVVAHFGAVATSILDSPIFSIFEDHFSLGEMERLLVSAERRSNTEFESLRTMFHGIEFELHMSAGNKVAATASFEAGMKREALTSTTSTGWKKLADNHMRMYKLVVIEAENPDYKQGLTHLQEWWKQHLGVGVSKMDQCYGYLKFATCYHGLGRVAEAARSVIKVVKIGQSFGPADCIGGDTTATNEFLYRQFAKFDKLDVFLDSGVASPGVPELSLKERAMMHRIITSAKEVEKKEEELGELFLQVRDVGEKLEEALEELELEETLKGLEEAVD